MTTTAPTTGLASQGGHWYQADGTPAYEVEKVKGGMRPATLRDARKLGLLPSVTGVIREASQPGLNRYFNHQWAKAAEKTPRMDDESEEHWLDRVGLEANVLSVIARDRGTAIHAAIEQMLEGRPVDSEYAPFAISVVEWIDHEYPGWAISAEKSFAHREHGYGGKIDLVLTSREDTVIIDFKTTDKDVDTVKGYESHIMQLAACREGIDATDATVMNLFVSSVDPWSLKAYEYDEDKVNQAWEMFKHLLGYWKWSRNYFPGRTR
jgi:hypothetical protein